MHIHLPDLSGPILAYMLVFARTGAAVMLLPAIGDHGVPARVRLILALAISFALAPTVAATYGALPAPGNSLALGLMVAKETTAGLMVGAMARIIVSSLQVAGFLIAQQTGLAYATSFDPTQNTQGAVVGSFLSLLGTVLIFATDLHHLAIGAIAGSYHMIPPGAALPTGDMAQMVIRLVSSSFALGFQLAAPFLVFSFAIYAALGVIARLMPQLQVFFLAMPVSILCGFLILALLLGSIMSLFLSFYTENMGSFL